MDFFLAEHAYFTTSIYSLYINYRKPSLKTRLQKLPGGTNNYSPFWQHSHFMQTIKLYMVHIQKVFRKHNINIYPLQKIFT